MKTPKKIFGGNTFQKKFSLGILVANQRCREIWRAISEGLLMVVSKRWYEFGLESKFRHPILTSILPQFYLSFTSILPLFNLFFTSFLPLLSRQSRTTVWKPRFTNPWNFGEIFCVLRFPGFGCPKQKISPKFHAKNGAKKGKFHANFTLLGSGADKHAL